MSVTATDVSLALTPGKPDIRPEQTTSRAKYFQDSLPLSPSLGRDHLGPLSPTGSPHLALAPPSPIPSQQESWEESRDKTEEAVAGPSNSSQDCWSPDSDQAKQGRKFDIDYG